MVEESVGRLRAIGRNVTGRIADAVSLPFADESFDIVAAHYMLYHVPDPRQALHEFRRVLRPGGTLVAASNGSPRETEALRIELARRTVDGVLQVQKETGLFVAKK